MFIASAKIPDRERSISPSGFYGQLPVSEAVVQRCTLEKAFLEISQNSQENTCARVSFFNKVAGLGLQFYFKKETLAQVFSCEFCKISKNTFLTEHVWATASADYQSHVFSLIYPVGEFFSFKEMET